MAKVIPFIVTAVAYYFNVGPLVQSLLTLASAAAVSVYEKHEADAQARNARLASLTDRNFTVRSGIAARAYVLGTVRTGGALMYIETAGTRMEALDSVVAFCDNRAEIVSWFFADEQIPVNVFPGTKFGGTTYEPAVDIFTVTGPTATVSLSFPARPGNDHRDPIHVTWRQGGASGTGAPTLVTPTQVSIGGLPSGSSVLTVSYQTADGSKLLAQFKPGTNTQIVTNWLNYTTPAWDASHALQGVCHGRTLMVWDQNIYQNGAPSVGAALKGHGKDGYPFYDPRDGSNPDTTSNPAIHAGWWMTLPRSLGGMGIPTDWIDWSTIAAAANICDELVTVRNLAGTAYETIARYSCDTVLTTSVSPLDNFRTILSAMIGTYAFTCGKYRVFAGAFRPATVVITDSDVVGDKPISVNTANVADTPPNIVTATFADASQGWVASSPKAVENAAYIAADGTEQPLDLQLNATTDARRCRYLMGVKLEQGRPAFGISLSVTGIGENIGLRDTVQLNLVNRPSYAGRTFEVASTIDNWDGTFDWQLVETKAATFALDPDSYTPITPVVPQDNSYLWSPPDPTGVLIAGSTPTTLPDGTTVSRVVLVWDPIPPLGNTPGASFQLRYRVTGGAWIDAGSVPGDATSTTLTAALQDGEVYQFEIRFVNGIGAMSNWVDAFTQVDGTPLPTPLSLRMSASSLLFRVPETGNALPVSVTLTAVRTGGLTAAASWSTSPSITLGGSGDVRTLAYVDMGSNDAVQVTLTVVQNGVTYVDTQTIVKVHDGASQQPDFTPPPTPTGLAVSAFLFNLVLTWDAPTFTVGRGYDATIVYAAGVPPGGPQPTFVSAVPVGSSSTNAFVYPVPTTGTTVAFWIKHQSKDGARSNSPAGGTNGVQGTTGLIAGVNLAPLLIDAGKLADGSVTATKLAAQAVDATKLASGLQAVTVITGALPGANVGNVIFRTDDGKLYKWNGSTYTAQIAAGDVGGQLSDAQLESISAAKLTGNIQQVNIAPGTIQSPMISAGAITSAQIAADTIVAGNIAANAIGASELAAGSVVAGKIAANAVTAGTISAAAVTAQQIAAGAITTDKLLVTGQGAALNADPACSDPSAWTPYSSSIYQANFAVVTDGVVGNTVMRTPASGPAYMYGIPVVPIDPAKTYRIRGRARSAGANGVIYIGAWGFDANRNIATTPWWAANAASPGAGWTTYEAQFGSSTTNPIDPSVRFMTPATAMNWGGTAGYMEMQDLRIDEVVGSSLIVDGGITATKLAANSIAVGTAAIQTGAIVNAMIGNAAIDSAKVLELQVGKLSGGILGADINVGVGHIVFDNGAVLRAQGVGFGTASQFVDWFGPRPAGGNIGLCSEGSATYYLKIDGTAYFGGALLAGKLFASAQGVLLTSANVCDLGPYSSNGGTITITAGLTFRGVKIYASSALATYNADKGSFANPSATMVLSRSINGGAFVDVQTTGATGTFTSTPPSAVDSAQGNYIQTMGSSFTFVDSNHLAQTREFRLRFSSWVNNSPVTVNTLALTSVE